MYFDHRVKFVEAASSMYNAIAHTVYRVYHRGFCCDISCDNEDNKIQFFFLYETRRDKDYLLFSKKFQDHHFTEFISLEMLTLHFIFIYLMILNNFLVFTKLLITNRFAMFHKTLFYLSFFTKSLNSIKM